MNIVMHCGGLPFDGNAINEKSLGGSETAAYYMAKELVKLGHDVKMFTNCQSEGVFDDVKYVPAGQITEQTPLGLNFEFYARNTPHDILIIQRSANAFIKPFASKVNILWLHDLALYRQRDLFLQQMWNIDAVLTVSEYHKQQVCEVYGLKQDFVHPVLNGVDPELFKDLEEKYWIKKDEHFGCVIKNRALYPYFLSSKKKYLLYSSRPERGLEHLVRPGGIMDRIKDEAPDCHLLVCGYENTTEQMRDYYNMLWQRCDELDNVTNIGALTKIELAQLMKNCWMHVYPTEFEEVSCITAMETATAGLPFLSSECAALPETCGEPNQLLPLKNDKADEDNFVAQIVNYAENGIPNFVIKEQKRKSTKYTWEHSSEIFNDTICNVFMKLAHGRRSSVLKHLLRNSDIVELQEKLYSGCNSDSIEDAIYEEYKECYKFFRDNDFKDHYNKYYEYEKNRGVNYGPENLDGNNRFEYVSSFIGNHPAGSVVLDYGCAHGHYTINLAKRFPAIKFIGVDIAESNITKAKKWAEEDKIENCEFHVCEAKELSKHIDDVDIVLICEVLEHVGDPNLLLDSVLSIGKSGASVLITTPYGPWEWQGYQEHWPWRAHLFEFEYADLECMFNKMPNFNIAVAPSNSTQYGESLGSYITTFCIDDSSKIQKYAKSTHTVPKIQTLSLCMIAYNSQYDIERCLNSVIGIVDEVIIGIDENTTDATMERALNVINKKHGIAYNFIVVKSPLEIGFDEARNQVIKDASGDWIIWLDADEELNNANSILPFLRNNQYDGYALLQHHVSANPPGIIKTDNPCKVFRNDRGIKFYGVVHEHPELTLGEGIPHVMGIQDCTIMHYGYQDEMTRRGRFSRNIDLLVRDREKFKNRKLGKFLWIRDLAQMNQYEMEHTGVVSSEMINRSNECIKLWRELVDEDLRMSIDALQYYSACVRLLGEGFEMSMSLDTNIIQGNANSRQVNPVEARFSNEEHAQHLQKLILHERVKNYESKYF